MLGAEGGVGGEEGGSRGGEGDGIVGDVGRGRRRGVGTFDVVVGIGGLDSIIVVVVMARSLDGAANLGQARRHLPPRRFQSVPRQELKRVRCILTRSSSSGIIVIGIVIGRCRNDLEQMLGMRRRTDLMLDDLLPRQRRLEGEAAAIGASEQDAAFGEGQ